ncbi:hypothetical protein KI387_019600, partial [Taxus chinensis]
KYYALVGDFTILANRSKYVDFTQPYSELGLAMVVAIQKADSSNPWFGVRSDNNMVVCGANIDVKLHRKPHFDLDSAIDGAKHYRCAVPSGEQSASGLPARVFRRALPARAAQLSRNPAQAIFLSRR